MKVLIITYYWPPAGGSGVQRWLKFVKYLKGYGIEPIIYTPDNPIYPQSDSTFLKEVPKNVTVIKKRIVDLTNLLFWKSNKKKTVLNQEKGGIISWLRGNVIIPDPKICWVKPSVRFLKKYINEHNIDLIISTGPPHSMHLIAQQLKQQNGIKWIADFRDPWTGLYYFKDFNLTTNTIQKHQKLESAVLKEADCVLTVSETMKEEFKDRAKKIAVITNGFDDEALCSEPVKLDSKFSISYVGLLPTQSNPTTLFKVLEELCAEYPNFKKVLQLNFIGTIAPEVIAAIKKYNLDANSNNIGYVAHKKAIQYQRTSQVLLLLIPKVEHSQGILTGKLFEYLAAKRPIVALGPEQGDLNSILKETKTGIVIDHSDEKQLKEHILELYEKFKINKLKVDSKHIMKYHRKELTKQLATIIKKI